MDEAFSTRFLKLARKRSPLCLGIDPSPAILKHWHLEDTIEGLQKFCEIITPLCEKVAIIKPQFAFFERFGPEGMKCLQTLIQDVKAFGTLTLADCKRGDISHTMTAYAQAILGSSSAFQADAMTVTAYLGLEAMSGAIEHAVSNHCSIFVVVRSSNLEGMPLQLATTDEAHTVADEISEQISRINLGAEQTIGPVGAVVGATLSDEAPHWCQKLYNSLILTPGIGSQGASYAVLNEEFNSAKGRLIPTESRSILLEGPDIERLSAQIQHQQEAAAQFCL